MKKLIVIILCLFATVASGQIIEPAITPGGSNTQIQFNDNGVFGGDAGFTYNKTTDVISVEEFDSADDADIQVTIGTDPGDDFKVNDILTIEGDTDLSTFTGAVSISTNTPTLTLTDTGDSNSATLSRTDTNSEFKIINKVMIPGALGNALRFDGVDADAGSEYVSLSHFTRPTNLTIAVWVKTPTFTSPIRTIMAWGGTSSGGHTAEFDITTDGKVVYGEFDGGATVVTSSASVDDGTYHHVAVVKTGTNIQLYIDGSPDNSGTINRNPSTSNLAIGLLNRAPDYRQVYEDDLDEIAVWDTNLVSTDISDMYASGAGLYLVKTNTFSTSGTTIGDNLKFLYHFDESSGDVVTDSSDSGNNGTRQNMEDADWVSGKVNIPGSDASLTGFSFKDGASAGEEGIVTAGVEDGGLVLQGQTIKVNTGGTQRADWDNDGILTLDNGETTKQQLILRAAATPSENILEVQDINEAILFQIESDGDLNLLGNTLTGDTADSGDLQLESTSHATKGRILFNSNGAFFDDPGELVIGKQTASSPMIGGVSYSCRIAAIDEGTNLAGVCMSQYNDIAAAGSVMMGMRSRNTHASPSVVQNGDILMILAASGYDGTDYENAARIIMGVDAAPGDDDMPGNILFQVAPDGSGSPATAVKVNQDKTVDFFGAINMNGETIYGNSTNSGNLTLASTSHATKGLIIFNNPTTGMVYDGDNERATIGGGTGAHDVNGVTEKALWEFHTDGNTQPGGTVYHRHSNTAGLSADATWLKSSGDHDTPTVVADGEQIGHLRFAGHDGTDYALTAEISIFIDGTPGDDDMPGRMLFLTSIDGNQTPTESFRVNCDQSILVATDNQFQLRDTAIGMYSQADTFLDLFADGAVRIGDSSAGAPTNYSKIEPDGTLEFNGNSTVFDDLRTPVSQVRVPGAKAPTWTAYNGTQLLGFSYQAVGGNEEEVYFVVQLPHSYKEGSNIVPHVHWIPNEDTTDDPEVVRWGLEYEWQNIDGTFVGTTTINAEESMTDRAGDHITTAFAAIDGSGKTISSMLTCRLVRNSSHANDTYDSGTALAFLLEIDFHFELDTVGSRLINDSK